MPMIKSVDGFCFGGLKPCLSSEKPAQADSLLSPKGFHELRKGFIPHEILQSALKEGCKHENQTHPCNLSDFDFLDRLWSSIYSYTYCNTHCDTNKHPRANSYANAYIYPNTNSNRGKRINP